MTGYNAVTLRIFSAALRVYTHKYADEIRRTEVVESGMQHEPNDDSTTILWKLSCDEVDEEAIDVLEKMLSFDESDALSELKQKLIGWKVYLVSMLYKIRLMFICFASACCFH